METKWCDHCKAELAIELFYVRSNGQVSTYCKACEIVRVRTRQHSNSLAVLAGAAKGRAKKKGSTCDIDVDYLKRLWDYQEGLCWWFGVSMDLDKGAFELNPKAVSIERLDTSKSYVRGNVVLATIAANLGRNSATYVLYRDFVINQLHLRPLDLSLDRLVTL